MVLKDVDVTKTDVEAEKLAISARESISSYCYTECKAYCCRKGYLLLTAEEVALMRNSCKDDLEMIPTDANEQRYVFNLGSRVTGCPNLENNSDINSDNHADRYKCIIHKDPKRPKACKEFPLFIWSNKTVMVTNVCPAVKEHKLYPYLVQFKSMGYKIIYGSDTK